MLLNGKLKWNIFENNNVQSGHFPTECERNSPENFCTKTKSIELNWQQTGNKLAIIRWFRGKIFHCKFHQHLNQQKMKYFGYSNIYWNFRLNSKKKNAIQNLWIHFFNQSFNTFFIQNFKIVFDSDKISEFCQI